MNKYVKVALRKALVAKYKWHIKVHMYGTSVKKLLLRAARTTKGVTYIYWKKTFFVRSVR